MDLEDQYDKLYRYCYFRVRDVQTAEDLVQETFLRWLDHYPGQREREALPTLYTIARNLCVDVTRQRETLPLQETDQVAADPAGTLVERWDLERALETLTPQDQELLLRAQDLEIELREETSLASFIAGFQLGMGIAGEIEPYSFEDEEERRAIERAKLRHPQSKN